MSKTFMVSARLRTARFLLLAVAALAQITLSACTDGIELTEAGARDRARIKLAAYYAGASATADAAVNRIRISVRTDPSGQTFGPFIFDVNPNDESWSLPVELPLSTATNVIVTA